MTDILDRVIIVDSVSKRFSACGARIGSLASKNRDIMTAALKLGQARLCVPTLEMIGAKACTIWIPITLRDPRALRG